MTVEPNLENQITTVFKEPDNFFEASFIKNFRLKYFRRNTKASATQKMSRKNSKYDLSIFLEKFFKKMIRYNYLESLILAQDERWRRA